MFDIRDMHFSIFLSLDRHLARIIHPLHNIIPFCKLIRQSKEGLERCEESDKNAFQIACEIRKPYIYECHAGLIDGVIPVLVGGSPVTFIMFGQFLFEPPTEKKFQRIWDKVKDLPVSYDELKDAFEKIPVISMGYVENIAEGLFDLINGIVQLITERIFPKSLEKERNMEIEFWLAQQHWQMWGILDKERELLSFFHWASGQAVRSRWNNIIREELETKDDTLWRSKARIWGIIVSLLSHLRVFRTSEKLDLLELTFHYASLLRHCNSKDEILELLERIINDLLSIRGEPNYRASIVDRAKEYILKNLSREDLSLGEVAKAMHLSPYYLSHLFKSMEGVSLGRYIRQMKVAKAKELLETSQLSITEIAFETGFSDPTHFSHVFKREYGVSPAQFRRQRGKFKAR